MATSLEDQGGNILRLATNNNYLLVEGITVPSDGGTGYATGCLFIHTDGGSATAIYVNEGSATNALFRRVYAGSIGSTLRFSTAAGSPTLGVVADANNPVTGANVYGRMTVGIEGGSLKYIPLYYATT